VADGLIVGSAIVRRVAEAETQPPNRVIKAIGDYVAELSKALDDTPAD
jgi:tryptophan synthase alpha chain